MRTSIGTRAAGIVAVLWACGGGGSGADVADAEVADAEVATETGGDEAPPDPGRPDPGQDPATDPAFDEGTTDPAGDPGPMDLPGDTPQELQGDLPQDLPEDLPQDLPRDPTEDPVEDPAGDPAPETADPGPETPGDAPPDLPADLPPDGGSGGYPVAWCPSAADYVGGDWAGTLEATATARYCGMFSESRTLDQERPAKVEMGFVEGTYPLPASSGTFPMTLPFCLRFLEDGTQPVLAGTGSVTATIGPTHYNFNYRQPLKTQGGDAWTLSANLSGDPAGGNPALRLDGSSESSSGYASLQLCRGDCSEWLDVRWLTSCTFDDATLNRHTVVFDGGQAVLDLRLGMSMAGTEPGVFRHAEGTLDGVPFVQDDYWDLVYNPEHHHFNRHFAVLFDAPIGSACGLRVEDFVPWEPAPTVHTTDCDLKPLESRAVQKATLERD